MPFLLSFMQTCPRTFLRICACLAWTTILPAFPPAPFYTIYGDVRNPYGELVPPEGAVVIVYRNGSELLRQTLTRTDHLDYNYQVRLRIDMMRAATGSYSSIALNPGATFSVAVNIGGQLHYPIGVSVPQGVGNPAERTRLDLVLGVDSDGDGLPDAWEEAQLYHAGYLPGPDGWDLSLIDRDGDLDGDGLSNWAEYIAGTYALDASSTLELEVREFFEGGVRLDFYALYGKIYTLEVSTDLDEWVPSPFALSEAGAQNATNAFYRSETTGITSIYTMGNDDRVFYRLTVR